jgi:hypothetical protein
MRVLWLLLLLCSAMPYGKRGMVDTTLILAKAPKLSLNTLEKALLESAGVQGRPKRDLIESLQINTPCGKLLTEVALPMKEGPDYMWLVCNPFAFLWLRCHRSAKFASFLFSRLRQGEIDNHLNGSIALYSDESVHGNQKRHDSANELQCIYWSICQLPSWFRMRKHGWFYFGFLHTSVQHEVRGDLSGLMKHTLRFFYQETHLNFATGIFLPMGIAESVKFVQFVFECFVQDEKAHKERERTIFWL